jgi:DNA-binding transcriptional LysR family regulator
MIRSDDLRFFAVVSREKSLAAAARRLDVTASAVTQRLQAMEAQLGLRLTHRNGRTMILTDDGQLLADRGDRIISELDALAETFLSRRRTISGHLRVLAPFGFGRRHVAPACGKFHNLNPDLKVELLLSDKLGRHPDQSWDVAIHVGEVPDSALKMRTLARNRRIVCAAPSYLQDRDPPATPWDLQHHSCIALRENEEDATLWKFQKDGQTLGVRIDPALSSNDGSVVRHWALEGKGIVIRSEWDVAGHIQDGDLVELLPDYGLPRADIVLMVSASAETAGRTRGFIDFLAAELARASWTRPVDLDSNGPQPLRP